MTNFLPVLDRIFAQYGTSLTITTAGAGRTVQAFVLPLDSTTEAVHFDANEQVGLIKPAGLLYVSGSEGSPPRANDTFQDDDFDAVRGTAGGHVILTVRKVFAYRLGGVVVLYLCVCD